MPQTKHLTNESVVELLCEIREAISEDDVRTLTTQLSYIRMLIAIDEFMEKQSTTLNRAYSKRLTALGYE